MVEKSKSAKTTPAAKATAPTTVKVTAKPKPVAAAPAPAEPKPEPKAPAKPKAKGPTLSNRAVVTRNSKAATTTAAIPATMALPEPAVIPVLAAPATEIPHHSRISVPLSQRDALVAEAAYFLAEARGFAPGNEAEDWIEAEKRIDDKFSFT